MRDNAQYNAAVSSMIALGRPGEADDIGAGVAAILSDDLRLGQRHRHRAVRGPAALGPVRQDGAVDPVVVVGAGISGVAAARALTDGGLPVVVLDRGKRIGGRMASRRTDGRVVDTGASYFTVSDDRFDAVVQGWATRGLARQWTDTFVAAHDGELEPKSGPVRWGAGAGLRSLVEDLADGLDVREAVSGRAASAPGPPSTSSPPRRSSWPCPTRRRSGCSTPRTPTSWAGWTTRSSRCSR